MASTMPDGTENDIPALALSVVKLFRDAKNGALETTKLDEYHGSEQLYDEMQRFRLWSGNVGAFHAPGNTRSLMYRLRNAPEVRRRIWRLLETLIRLLGHSSTANLGNSGAKAEPGIAKDTLDDQLFMLGSEVFTLDEHEESWLVASISDTITRLFKISALLAKFTPRDQFLRSQSARLPQLSAHYDIARIIDKFTGCRAEQWLLNRLGTANAMRRQALMYYREHRGIIADHPVVYANSVTGPQASSALHMPSLWSRNPINSGRQSVHPSAVPATAPTIEPDYEAPIEDILDESHSGSTAATSVAGLDPQNTLRVPALPDASVAEPFECPYCYTYKRLKGQHSWRRHVFADIRPYICTFSECGMLLFDSKSTWISHELEEHRRHWICEVCNSHQSMDRRALAVHLESTHAGMFSDAQLQLLLKACSKPKEQYNANECLLCDWEEHLRLLNPHTPPSEGISVTARHFMKHLASHLEQVALFTLPRPAFGDEYERSGYATLAESADRSQTKVG
ncbi:hypothetical protein LTR27_006272 [Elasticomyces elasticus]|nr:hypothetical protein LTR27_006272 [Elasticomyces elasticus]